MLSEEPREKKMTDGNRNRKRDKLKLYESKLVLMLSHLKQQTIRDLLCIFKEITPTRKRKLISVSNWYCWSVKVFLFPEKLAVTKL